MFQPLHNFTSFPSGWRAAFIKSINLYRESESINSSTINIIPGGVGMVEALGEVTF
jgi:hypothetical protein